MIDVNEVHDITYAITAKAKAAFPSPADWNLYANYANMDLFNFYNDERKTLLLKNKSGNSLQMPMALKPFVVNEENISFTSGVGVCPASQISSLQLSVLVNSVKREVKKIDITERETYINSTIDAPSATYPVYIEEGNSLLLYPTNITTAFLSYLKSPVTVVWAYTLSGGRPLYDAGHSVQFEWQPTEKQRLIGRILEYMGLSIREQMLVQGAEQLKQEAS